MTPQITAEKPPNEFSRVIGVYLDPRETFRDVSARPRWWVPMIVISLCSLVFIYCFSQRVGWDRMIRQTLESSTRMQNLPPEQRERAIEMGARFAPISGYATAVVGRPLSILICAGIFLLVFNVFLGAKITFQQGMAVTAYSFLTLALSSILSTVTLFLKSPEDFDIRNPLAFNLGFFLSDDSASKAMIALANSIDLFSLWTLAVLAIGFSVCAKMSFTKALMGVTLPWLIYVALNVARASVFGQ
jgi:hypothetical protein